jgi:hypothetical protein
MSKPDYMIAGEKYIDGVFGEGMGERHSQFLDKIQNDALREQIHRFHILQDNTAHISIEENYLLGMTVMCAVKSLGTAAMFAKTLLYMGVKKEKILEAVGRLSMWIGGLAAVEASFTIQKAIREYEKEGAASLAGWFPQPK